MSKKPQHIHMRSQHTCNMHDRRLQKGFFTHGTIVSLTHIIMNTFNNVNQLFNSPFPFIPNQHFGYHYVWNCLKNGPVAHHVLAQGINHLELKARHVHVLAQIIWPHINVPGTQITIFFISYLHLNTLTSSTKRFEGLYGLFSTSS